ncbi:hypothetical protein ACH5RR_001409 [Cinchona calisaya]|uniref:Uncharacterized protein n=1 Tax=Cinchona calisaya TaxID=153742 RepID=A0ABD3B3E7_9GENT
MDCMFKKHRNRESKLRVRKSSSILCGWLYICRERESCINLMSRQITAAISNNGQVLQYREIFSWSYIYIGYYLDITLCSLSSVNTNFLTFLFFVFLSKCKKEKNGAR